MNEPIIVFNMTWSNIIAITSLVISIVVAFMNYRLNKKRNKENNFVLNVTAERNKWLESIRQDIASYCGLVKFYTKSICNPSTKEGKSILKDIDRLGYMIKLRLNPNEDISRDIFKVLDKIPKVVSDTDINMLNNNIDELIRLSQKLLKEEWEKVKNEACAGNEIKKNQVIKFIEKSR